MPYRIQQDDDRLWSVINTLTSEIVDTDLDHENAIASLMSRQFTERDVPWRSVNLASSEWQDIGVLQNGVIGLTGPARTCSSGALANGAAASKLGGESFLTRGSRFDIVDWTKPLSVLVRFCISSPVTTSAARFTIGKNNAEGIGNIAHRGIGFQINNKTLIGIVHSGTGLTAVTLAPNVLVDSFTTDVLIQSDGKGKVKWYLDDELAGQTLLGPKTMSATVDETNIQMEVTNGNTGSAVGFSISDIMWKESL